MVVVGTCFAHVLCSSRSSSSTFHVLRAPRSPSYVMFLLGRAKYLSGERATEIFCPFLLFVLCPLLPASVHVCGVCLSCTACVWCVSELR
jgi:hypothetical protein